MIGAMLGKGYYNLSGFKFYPVTDRGTDLIGFVSFVINGDLFMNCMGVHLNKDKESVRIAYPKRSRKEVKMNVFNPINNKFSNKVSKEVFKFLKGEKII